MEHLIQINQHVKRGKLKVHFAVNTGMNRIGFDDVQKFKSSFNFANKLNCVDVEGIFTHFYNAISEINTHEQFCIFNHFLKAINNYNNIKNLIVHTSASDASFLYNEYAFDMVRLGISLYGYSEVKLNLKPALSITSKIINICKVKKGGVSTG